MDVNYEISKEADIDLNKAICFFRMYDKEEAFTDDLINQLRLICSMPKAFQLRYKKVRIVQLEHFNYSIHYTIFNKRILILKILNQNQNF
ncbi:type II toxin-antitoxin system RelE/ParE family toxin [Mariniflexile sp.]|uniref:type II toxin-antitoxin system RelE/ParE family toxin n=1 Tax=Mariniflexile sp. TaxID=1979402 RepID=UPI004047347C